MRRVLVTGAAGRLGAVVLDALRQRRLPTTALVLSTSDQSDGLAADKVVIGNARDPATVAEALRDVDAVVHLAAIPAPTLGTAEEVFGLNTMATFTVLEQAGRAGVHRAVIASSLSVTGLPFARTPLVPAYVPFDEELPLQVEDPYALSKQVDEATAAMMWRRHGLSVVAMRFPFLGDAGTTLPWRAAQAARDPGAGSRELWSYLDLRDAAQACLAGLTVAPPGCHIVGLAAPLTISPYPTEDLLARYLPSVHRRRRFPGRTAPFDLTRANQLLAFTPQHLWPVEQRSLP